MLLVPTAAVHVDESCSQFVHVHVQRIRLAEFAGFECRFVLIVFLGCMKIAALTSSSALSVGSRGFDVVQTVKRN